MRVLIPEMRGDVRVQERRRPGAAIVGVGRAVLVHVRERRGDEPEQQGQHREGGARLAEHMSMVVGQSGGCQAPGGLHRGRSSFVPRLPVPGSTSGVGTMLAGDGRP